jgi:hypothetical protein
VCLFRLRAQVKHERRIQRIREPGITVAVRPPAATGATRNAGGTGVVVTRPAGAASTPPAPPPLRSKKSFILTIVGDL